VAIAAPLIALVMAAALRDVPTKAGLGVQDWSWFYGPDKQITELEKVLGEGRRLPVERLMSWADLRFGRTGAIRGTAAADAAGHELPRSEVTRHACQCAMRVERRTDSRALQYRKSGRMAWRRPIGGVGDFLPGRICATGGHACDARPRR
jgi:hypothetical protein